jgi:hypothetical protein
LISSVPTIDKDADGPPTSATNFNAATAASFNPVPLKNLPK